MIIRRNPEPFRLLWLLPVSAIAFAYLLGAASFLTGTDFAAAFTPAVLVTGGFGLGWVFHVMQEADRD